MCHILNGQAKQKNQVWDNKNVKKGPKLGSKYLSTKRTVCALCAHCVNGDPYGAYPLLHPSPLLYICGPFLTALRFPRRQGLCRLIIGRKIFDPFLT